MKAELIVGFASFVVAALFSFFFQTPVPMAVWGIVVVGICILPHVD